MKVSILGIFIAFVFSSIHTTIYAQCESWNNSPKQREAMEAHALYRQEMKTKNYELAFKYWQKAFELAPAANGKIDYHFIDGIELFKNKYKKATDKAKKTEYLNKIYKMYDQAVECVLSGAIKKSGYTPDQRAAYLRANQAYDMYYEFDAPDNRLLSVLSEALERGGNAFEYYVMNIYADVLVREYAKEDVSKEEARATYLKLNEVADYNIKNNADYKEEYKTAKAAMNETLVKLERAIFDCNFFKKKFKPEFNANPKDYERIKEMYGILKAQGCDDSDPMVVKLGETWKSYADSVNQAKKAEFEANNPGYVARQLYDSGDYEGAIAKYEEAIANETDDEKKAEYHFGIASIQYRKLNKYSSARNSAREAAKLKDNWGRPYMLIGDMYASSSRSCGSDAYSRGLAILAALEKYRYAKSIDPEVAEDAQKRINRYSSSIPPKDEVFMRGKAGATETVPCWIGESVKVPSYK